MYIRHDLQVEFNSLDQEVLHGRMYLLNINWKFYHLPLGTYSPGGKTVSCTMCPTGTNTVGQGATSVDQCTGKNTFWINVWSIILVLCVWSNEIKCLITNNETVHLLLKHRVYVQKFPGKISLVFTPYSSFQRGINPSPLIFYIFRDKP